MYKLMMGNGNSNGTQRRRNRHTIEKKDDVSPMNKQKVVPKKGPEAYIYNFEDEKLLLG
jgi:hypothetical protein